MQTLAIIVALFACQALAQSTQTTNVAVGTTQGSVIPATTVAPSPPSASTQSPPPPPPATTQAPVVVTGTTGPAPTTTAAPVGATTGPSATPLYLTTCFFGPLPVYTTGSTGTTAVHTTGTTAVHSTGTTAFHTTASTTAASTTAVPTTEAPASTTAVQPAGTTAVQPAGTTALQPATTGVPSLCSGASTCTPQTLISTAGQCVTFLPAADTTVPASAQFYFSVDNNRATVYLYNNANCNATGNTLAPFYVTNNGCYEKALPFHNLPVIFSPAWTSTPPNPTTTTGVSAAAFSAPSVFVALFAVLVALLAL